MDKGKNWRFLILAGLQVLAVAAIVAATMYLLCRYLQYGEHFVRETGSRPVEVDTENEDGQGGVLPDMIRVCILTNEFQSEYHQSVELMCEETVTVEEVSEKEEPQSEAEEQYKHTTAEQFYTGNKQKISAGESYQVAAAELAEGKILLVSPQEDALITVTSIERADGNPKYAGSLYLYREAEGIILINELPLEEYLCSVVSSEIPSDYPAEAQKAQAVCARTYAYNCIRTARNSDELADLDDSVNYQVYNNYRSTEVSRSAVRKTAGEILPLNEIQYYSTSCQSEHREDLDNEKDFRVFLSQEPDAGAEYNSPWLRWTVELSKSRILDMSSELYGWQADQLDEIEVTRRSGNGQVQTLEVRSGEQTLEIKGEYKIRQILSPYETKIHLMDGRNNTGMQLLPSAFFWIESGDAITIHGGGYGHGIGMSQNGAAALAEDGMDYQEILAYYYGCQVRRFRTASMYFYIENSLDLSALVLLIPHPVVQRGLLLRYGF